MPALSKKFLDIQATIEYGFTLKRVRDMTRTYSQMHRTDKYSQHSSIIWPIWLNGWVFVYERSGCGFESICNHLNFRFRVCFEEGVPWHWGNYGVWIHFFFQTYTHVQFEQLHKYIQKRNKIYKKWYTQKQFPDIKVFGISKKQANKQTNKKRNQ